MMDRIANAIRLFKLSYIEAWKLKELAYREHWNMRALEVASDEDFIKCCAYFGIQTKLACAMAYVLRD